MRPEAGSYAANLPIANTLFISAMDERRSGTPYLDANGQPQTSSLWLRNAGGHQRFRDGSGQLKTRVNRYVMQLGGDVAQWSSNGSDRFHLGVMGGYANAQSTTHSTVTGYRSTGDVSGYSTGLYGRWSQHEAQKNGGWVDGWASWSWFDNSVQGEDIAAERYKSRGLTASLAAGYAFAIGQPHPRQRTFIQPQAQANWLGITADDHREQNGSRVAGNGSNTLQTRLGVRLFSEGHSMLDDGKQRSFMPFVEANWIHNSRTFGNTLNGVTVSQAGTAHIGELKAGVNAALGNRVSLWGSLGQQLGGQGYSDSSANLGIKINF